MSRRDAPLRVRLLAASGESYGRGGPLTDHAELALDALREIERLERYRWIPSLPPRLSSIDTDNGYDPYNSAPLWRHTSRVPAPFNLRTYNAHAHQARYP